jgi:hypothetical protein
MIYTLIIAAPVLSVKFHADFPASVYLLGLRGRRMQLNLF